MAIVQIPEELIEQISRGNCVLFAGPGISERAYEQEGVPSQAEIVRVLIQKAKLPEQVTDLPRVAQWFEQSKGRRELISVLREVVEDVTEPLQAHQAIAQLMPIRVIITACLDDLLLRAFQITKRKVSRVIRDYDATYQDQQRAEIVKIYGTIDDADTVVITREDLLSLFDNPRAVSIFLQYYFATKTLLFVGFSLDDFYFEHLYHRITSIVDRHQRRAYVVQQGPSPWQIADWRHKNIEVVDSDTTLFLKQLVTQVHSIDPLLESAQTIPLPVRPYKFLDYYEESDTRIFFGRETEKLLLARQILSHKVVTFFGSSGVGKTSLINAGAIPYLRAEGYRCVVARALPDPIAALKRAIAAFASNQQQLNDEVPLAEFTVALLEPGSRVVLFLDQFEEAFIGLTSEIRSKLVKQLAACLELVSIDLRLVVSLREDYLAYLEEWQNILPYILTFRFRLSRLSDQQARLAIIEPAVPYGISYEDVLIDQLLTELDQSGVEPPQLQIVCDQLFNLLDRQAGEREITLAHYERLGGVRDLLVGYLDTVLQDLSLQDQAIIKAITKALVTGEKTKALLTLDQIAADYSVRSSKLTLEEIRRALDLLQSKRVVRWYPKENRYELAHEYLVEKIEQWMTQQEREVKRIRELIKREMESYKQVGVYLDVHKLDLIGRYRDKLALAPEELMLMLVSSVQNQSPMLSVWTELARQMPHDHSEQLVEQLAPLARSEQIEMRILAAKVLHDLGTASAQSLAETSLMDLAASSDVDVKWRAIGMLCNFIPGRAIVILAQAISESDHAIRRNAYAILRELARRYKLMGQRLSGSPTTAATPAPRQVNVQTIDMFTTYETGLRKLLDMIDRQNPRYQDALLYKWRLERIIADCRRIKDVHNNEADRSRIIDALNQLTLDTCHLSFNSLCDYDSIFTDQELDRRSIFWHSCEHAISVLFGQLNDDQRLDILVYQQRLYENSFDRQNFNSRTEVDKRQMIINHIDRSVEKYIGTTFSYLANLDFLTATEAIEIEIGTIVGTITTPIFIDYLSEIIRTGQADVALPLAEVLRALDPELPILKEFSEHADSGRASAPAWYELLTTSADRGDNEPIDEFGLLERGLTSLRQLADENWIPDFLIYELRLSENMANERRFGQTDETLAERNSIIDGLNGLALQHLGISFDKLAGTSISNPSSMTADSDNDQFIPIERALDEFQRLAEGTNWYESFSDLDKSLRKHIQQVRSFGSTRESYSNEARIVDELNTLALAHLDISFNDLVQKASQIMDTHEFRRLTDNQT